MVSFSSFEPFIRPFPAISRVLGGYGIDLLGSEIESGPVPDRIRQRTRCAQMNPSPVRKNDEPGLSL